MSEMATTTLRSVLPHEPKPPIDSKGYVSLQGSFIPKVLHEALGLVGNSKSKVVEKAKPDEELKLNEIRVLLHKKISKRLEQTLCSVEGSQSPLKVSSISISLQVNFSKCDLVFPSHDNATEVTLYIRKNGISPQTLLEGFEIPCECLPFISDIENGTNMIFSRKQLQATQLTAIPLPTSPHWPRVSPPKFRRLINPPRPSSGGFGSYDKVLSDLEYQRRITRFLFVSGFGDSHLQSWIEYSYISIDNQLRVILENYESSGDGVELWFPPGKSHFYIGMRSNKDASRVMTELQGKRIQFFKGGQKVVDTFEEKNDDESIKITDRLFLDWADITQRSNEKGRGADKEKGEPSKSECTSNTADVEIPGLILIPDFLNEDMENILHATVTGPTATWYRNQERPSGGNLKRRVQHYGYVFDYETSDVIREKAVCPPLPCLPKSHEKDTHGYIKSAIETRDGWGLLAGIIEKTRQSSFGSLRFPDINQLTVNEYDPAQGIGSHIGEIYQFGYIYNIFIHLIKLIP